MLCVVDLIDGEHDIWFNCLANFDEKRSLRSNQPRDKAILRTLGWRDNDLKPGFNWGWPCQMESRPGWVISIDERCSLPLPTDEQEHVSEGGEDGRGGAIHPMDWLRRLHSKQKTREHKTCGCFPTALLLMRLPPRKPTYILVGLMLGLMSLLSCQCSSCPCHLSSLYLKTKAGMGRTIVGD